MFGAIGRLIVVPLALLVSVLVSGLIAFQIAQELVTRAGHEPGNELVVFTLLSAIVMFVSAGAVSGLPLVVAVAAVIVGEVARIRSVLYYVASGGLAAASFVFAIKGAPHWQVFATAGFAGGLVYWALAGRKA